MSQSSPSAPEPDGPSRILVAEDLATVRDIACAMLAQAGYVVDAAADGAQAVALAASRRYALILMDVNMPEVDGVEATGRIRDLDAPHGNVPILAMTAERSQARLRRILDAGMNGHLCKPFKRADLLAAIDPWVR